MGEVKPVAINFRVPGKSESARMFAACGVLRTYTTERLLLVVVDCEMALMVALNEQFHHNGTTARSNQCRAGKSEESEKSEDRFASLRGGENPLLLIDHRSLECKRPAKYW